MQISSSSAFRADIPRSGIRNWRSWIALAVVAAITFDLVQDARPKVYYPSPGPRIAGVSGNGIPFGLLGCYAILDWRDRPVGADFYNGSNVVRLDTLPEVVDRSNAPLMVAARSTKGQRLAGYGVMRGLDHPAHHTPLFHGLFMWKIDRSNRDLSLSFSNALSGASVQILAEEVGRDTMRGTMHENWDYGPPFTGWPHGVHVVRVGCP